MSDFSVFSKIFDLGIQGDITAIWCSNQLSNLSNVLYTSNVLFSALSNFSNTLINLSNTCTLWSFESNDPMAFSNIGTLPRFVYNSNSDKTFYVDCLGTSVPLSGFNSNTPIDPNKTEIIAFKTAAGINGILEPSVGDSYIVTTGDLTTQSDIATWDGEAWSFYSPKDGEFAVVTTSSGTYLAGTYKYDAATDLWIFLSGSSNTDSNAGTATAPMAVGNFALTSQEDVMHNQAGGPLILSGDSLMTWSDGTQVFNAGDYTTAYGMPRLLSWNWASLLTGSNAKSASYAPVFTDAARTNTYVLALDSKGKVWATGNQLNGTGLAKTTASTGVVRPVDLIPYYGFAPVPFFQSSSNADVIIRKVYVPNCQTSGANACSAALSQTGDLYVTGVNNYGNLGLGNTTAQPNWAKYAVSNVKDVKISQLNMFVLTNDNKLYMSGYDAYSIGGTTANKTTPLFLGSNVSTFEFGHINGISLYVVRKDGTLWTAGYNNLGQLGLGTTTTQVGLAQVPGISNAEYVVASKNDASAACLLHKDGTISFSGADQVGEFGFTGHAAATTVKTFIKPTGSFQGLVKKVALGVKTCIIQTATGALYSSGQMQWRGLGAIDNSWNNRLFTQIPLPEAVAGFRLFSDANLYDGMYALTTKGRVYAYGSIVGARWNSAMNYMYSPTNVPIRQFDHGIGITASPPDLTQLKAKITATGTGIATTSFNANTNTVTFKIPYAGSIGTLNTSTWAIVGTGVTVTNIQNPVYVSYTTGQITFTATVTSTDIGIAAGASVAQAFTVTMDTNGTATVAGTRVNDLIAASLSTNKGTYVGAKVGDWVEVGSNEYFALRSNISMSNTFRAGANDTLMAATTNTAWSGANTVGNITSPSFTSISTSNFPYAISFVPSTTQATVTYQPKMSDFAFVGYANIGSSIITSTTLNVPKYYVLRGASARTTTTTPAFVGWYASVLNIKGFTTGTYTYTAGNVSTVSTNGAGAPSWQVLTSPTKVWA
jgi:alpha-tubulin suppressor-like RCC1 family protein